jgi:superfamily II DNA or RNA helicase
VTVPDGDGYSGIYGGEITYLKGGIAVKERARRMRELVLEEQPRLIVAIGSYIGESFDDSRLDTLFPAMPISWRGTSQQYVGRLHRLHDSMKIVEVYDYVDSSIPMPARTFENRLRGYKAPGFSIHKPEERQTGYSTGTSGREGLN